MTAGVLRMYRTIFNDTKPNGTVVTRFTSIALYVTPDAVKGFNQNKAKESADYEY